MLSPVNSLKYIAHCCLEKARELNPLKVKVQHYALQILQGIKEVFEKTYLLVSKRFRKSDHNSSSIPTIANTALNQQNLISDQSISHPLLQSISFNDRQNLTLDQLTAQLDNWKRSSIAKGDKEQACNKILAAFRNNSETLDLSCLQLTELPLVIGQLTQLKSLNLNRNKLTALPSTIGNLTQLTRLDVSDNEDLTSLPLSLGEATMLLMIFIENTRISVASCDSILDRCRAKRNQ